LVLHGGGSAGNAWEIGVLAGLFDGGLDVTDADLIVGTSAGATATAQITSAALGDLFATTVTPLQAPPAGVAASAGARLPAGAVAGLMARTGQIIAASSDAADMRRRLGVAALELDAASDGTYSAQWRATVAARLPGADWPEHNIRITAVDARTGEGVVFDRRSGVDLVDAVAASTSSGAPYRIGDARYLDGGYRRNENADLAAGFARVLVLSPFSGQTRQPLEWRMQLAAQVDELRADGSAVETVFPDADSLTAFGDNMMNLAARPPAARAGYEQGKALAEHLAGFWR
jgi:NTE family protein